ncbi:hypothetical protein QJ856_gp0510 [Tupanvirus deep ocean]|uniref:Uncharacterized protein n=2 Tax=Tupanvirus TaxID=2094720 RepID=A0AC62A941_9VIRU|nr:hypothetical protein QJ856_gp0510 [Tupanvirus deep ocean]QKU34234.1 hypothetical protein [Tupanvirus deep ocean]
MATSTEVIKALRICDINVEEVVIGTKKTNRTVPITYKSKPLVFQTPFLEVKGGLRKTAFPNIYQFDTLFKGDTKQKIHNWYQFIENLETHVSNQVVSNGSSWFTQKYVNIKSLIRELDPSKEVFFLKWPVDLKINIFVDENKKPFNPVDLKDGDCVKLIVEISDLWISENNCGLAVIVQKILVKQFFEKPQSEYIFNDTDSESERELDDDENNIISLLATEQKTRPLPKQQQNDAQQKQQNNTHLVNKKTSQATASQQPIFNHIVTQNLPNGGSVRNDKINDTQFKREQKERMQTQNKIANEAKETVMTKNSNQEQNLKKKQLPQMSKFIDKDNANPFRNDRRKQTSLNEVLSDLSDDGEFRFGNQNNIQRLMDEYSPSSNDDEINEDEINDDDLEYD